MDVPNSDKYGLQPWILKKLQLDTPDMLVNYILLLISNDKTIPEITTELGELLGEDEARAFTSSLEVEMKRKTAPAAPAPASAASSSSSSSSGAKRLLQTAIQPAVSARNGGEGRGKRSLDERTEEHAAPREQKDEASAEPKRARGSGNQDPTLQMPSMQMPPMSNNAMGNVSSANVFLQQMNMMAQAAGYRDADAMMAAEQARMLEVMSGGGGGGGGRGRGGGGGFVGGRGRGGGGGYRGRGEEDGYAAPSGRGRGRGRGDWGGGYDGGYDGGYEGGYDAGRGRGRGRGRGGYEGGRGEYDGGRGRGRGGRGGRAPYDPFGGKGRGRGVPIDETKTYVRIDLNGALNTSR